MGVFYPACSTGDVPKQMTKVVEVNGKKVLLVNDCGEFYALSPYCSHDGANMDADRVADHAIQCPRHGATFDVRDGSVIRMPAVFGLATYDVKVEDDTIHVELDR